MKYKARAECTLDIFRLLESVRPVNWSASGSLFGAEVEFRTDMPLSAVRRRLSKIPDGHAMLESVNFAAKYNGERYHRR